MTTQTIALDTTSAMTGKRESRLMRALRRMWRTWCADNAAIATSPVIHMGF